jgi:menaquinone-dependent protoporphyrinogen oxidase
MSARILVAYASVRGSTKEIAQAIGKELQAAGHSVDVMEMKSVLSLEDYHAVVIGAPLYMGKAVGDVGKFVKRHHDALATRPVAAFTVGVTPIGNKSEEIENAMKIFRRALAPLEPVAATIFAGKVDPAKLPFFQKWIWQKVKGPVGDFRNWDAITQWAREIPAKLQV